MRSHLLPQSPAIWVRTNGVVKPTGLVVFNVCSFASNLCHRATLSCNATSQAGTFSVQDHVGNHDRNLCGQEAIYGHLCHPSSIGIGQHSLDIQKKNGKHPN